MTTTTKSERLRPNLFPGRCDVCGARVRREEGIALVTSGSRARLYCRDHAPMPPQEPAPTPAVSDAAVRLAGHSPGRVCAIVEAIARKASGDPAVAPEVVSDLLTAAEVLRLVAAELAAFAPPPATAPATAPATGIPIDVIFPELAKRQAAEPPRAAAEPPRSTAAAAELGEPTRPAAPPRTSRGKTGDRWARLRSEVSRDAR